MIPKSCSGESPFANRLQLATVQQMLLTENVQIRVGELIWDGWLMFVVQISKSSELKMIKISARLNVSFSTSFQIHFS